MPVNIMPNQSLNDVPYGIQHKLSQILDMDHAWRQLVAVISNEQNYVFRDYEIEAFAREAYRLDGSPSRALLTKLGVRAMTVRELCRYLDVLRLERPLKLLKDPEPLKLIEEPQNVRTRVGLPFQLTCRAEGFPYPQYQWFCGTVKLADATKETLAVTHASQEDAGKYICRVHNSLTSKDPKWSRWCLVTVDPEPPGTVEELYRRVPAPCLNSEESWKEPPSGLYAPRIEEHPADVQVTYGKRLCLRCRAVGNPVVRYQWRKNGTTLPGKDQQDLEIPSCILDDKGTYECVVENSQGEVVSNPAQVFVNDIPTDVPVIITLYGEMSVPEGYQVELQIQVKCAMAYRCQWYLNRQPIKHAIQEKYTFLAKKSCAGIYQCIVTPERGDPVPAREARITVTELPVTYPPGKVALLIGISSYRNYKHLPAAKADILKFQSILEKMGFLVLTLLDLDRTEMVNSINLFCFMLQQHMYGVMYFVGHGFEDNSQQCWLVPCDAHHGCTDINDCVSAEYIIHCIQEKNPDLCLVILDICREKPNQPVKETCHFPIKAKGNLCVYYATSRGQKAYEERDGTEGIFMHNLSKVLNPDRRISLLELFEQLMEALGEDTMAAEDQIPEIRTNLRQMRRTLHDPTYTDGHTASVDKMFHIWKNSQRCPDDRQLQFGEHRVTVRYQPVVSNVLKLSITGRPCTPDSYCRLKGIEVPPEIIAKVPLQDPEQNQYEVELSQLQKVKHQMTIILKMVCKSPLRIEEKHSQRLDLGKPLVGAADLWKKLISSEDSLKGGANTKPKELMEHDERNAEV